MSDCSSVVVAGLGDSSCMLVDRQSQLSVTIANVRTKRESKLVFRDWAVCCVGGPPTRDWSFGGLSVSHGESAGARTYLCPGRAGDDMRSDSNDDKLPSRVHRCSSQCVCVCLRLVSGCGCHRRHQMSARHRHTPSAEE